MVQLKRVATELSRAMRATARGQAKEKKTTEIKKKMNKKKRRKMLKKTLAMTKRRKSMKQTQRTKKKRTMD